MTDNTSVRGTLIQSFCSGCVIFFLANFTFVRSFSFLLKLQSLSFVTVVVRSVFRFFFYRRIVCYLFLLFCAPVIAINTLAVLGVSLVVVYFMQVPVTLILRQLNVRSFSLSSLRGNLVHVPPLLSSKPTMIIDVVDGCCHDS